MELLWGDESCPGVAVPEVTGLPPGVILHADNLEDVAPFKGYSCILARNGGIPIRIVVKKSLHKQLRKENHFMFLPSNRQTGDKGKYTILYAIYFIYWLILLFSYSSFVNFLCILAMDITSLSDAFSHMLGNIFETWPWSEKIICLNPLQMLPAPTVSSMRGSQRGLWKLKFSTQSVWIHC